MKLKTPKDCRSKDPDIIGSYPAMLRAARYARELGRKTNTPVYVLIKGRIVDLTAQWRRRQRQKRQSRQR